VDKDGFAPRFADVTQQVENQPTSPLPTEQKFLSLWNDFFYHAIWSAKKLRRGELWTAKSCIDNYMKWQLLEAIAWHAKVKHGAGYDTWHNGRFLEKWADPRAVAGLRIAFGHYDDADVRRALLATLDLFRWLAREIAEGQGFSYPSEADQRITEWIKQCLSVSGPAM
jgi:aminoglycoside 6-adenylyltransferase